jgi:hypothetical protein
MVTADFGRSLQVEQLLALEPFTRLKQAWINTFDYFVSHPQQTIFLEQYKNSPYHREEPPENELSQLAQVIAADIAAGHIKNFPVTVLYDMTITVAISLAKQVVRGQLTVDDALLDKVATACCQALLA